MDRDKLVNNYMTLFKHPSISCIKKIADKKIKKSKKTNFYTVFLGEFTIKDDWKTKIKE